MFELAEIYNEMMDLKMIRANTQADTQSLDKHSIKKINHLCSSAAKWVSEWLQTIWAWIWLSYYGWQLLHLFSRYFQMFLDSLRSPDGKFPEKMEEDVLRPALVARFRMARLYSKLICSLPSAQLENLNKALDNYTYEEPIVHCIFCRLKEIISRRVKIETGDGVLLAWLIIFVLLLF